MNFSFWLETAGSFLLQNRRTSIILGFLISVAVGSLVFIISLANGISDIMVVNSTGMYTGQISGENLSLDLSPEDLNRPFVTAVIQRYRLPAVVKHGNHSQALELVAMFPEKEMEHSSFYRKVTAGEFLHDGRKEILLSRKTAERIDVAPGDIVEVRTDIQRFNLKVVGIFHTSIDQMDQAMSFCPVFTGLTLPQEWQAAIFIKTGTELSSAMTDYWHSGSLLAGLQPWTRLMPDLTQLLELNEICVNILVIIVLSVVSLGTASSFAIFIVGHMKEYGIMRAMGVTGWETSMLIYFQVIIMNAMASLIGVLAGISAVWIFNRTGIDLSEWTSHNRYFAVTATIFPRFNQSAVWYPPALSLGFCFFSAIWPVWLVVQKKTCDIISGIL